MKLAVIAIGKPGRGPEATLAADYAERATLAGRALGLGPLDLIDLEARKPGKAAEAELILKAAAMLRDRGERRLAFAIGGADGLDDSVRAAAASTLAFGPQTWPHALARAMLTEQLYRAVTILAGSPYHRD